jgi:hypothetical protein
MQEIYAKIQLAVHTDSGTDFNVLSINHNIIFFLLVLTIQKPYAKRARTGGTQNLPQWAQPVFAQRMQR